MSRIHKYPQHYSLAEIHIRVYHMNQGLLITNCHVQHKYPKNAHKVKDYSTKQLKKGGKFH